MQVKMAKNGWQGTWLPGDESLGFASELEMLAEWLEKDELARDKVAAWLREKARPFRECWQPERDCYSPIDW